MARRVHSFIVIARREMFITLKGVQPLFTLPRGLGGVAGKGGQ